jgi:hypothetical protein
MNMIKYLLFFPIFALANSEFQISQSEMRTRLQELSHQSWKGQINESNPIEIKNCLVSKIQIPVRAANGESWFFEFTLTQPTKVKKAPLVMIVPTIERSTPLESTLLYQFCQAGVAGALIDANDNSHPDPLPGWNHENTILRKTIITLKTILDWAKKDTRFDPLKISLYGHSLGGVTASLMAGVEIRRLNSVIVTVGAGNMPGVMTHSIYFRVASLKLRRMAITKMTSQSEYETELKKHIRYDPLYFSSRVNPQKMYFVMASGDLSVPFRYQLQTHQAFGSPEYHLFSPGTHIDGMIRLATLDFQKLLSFVLEVR